MFRTEIIDYFDSSNQSVVARVPESGSAAIQYGAQLVVQQNQAAVFYRDGRAMDQFGPGKHTLTTGNLPLIGRILSAPFERSPFQAQVYFVGMQTFMDQRWGTRQPIMVRDPDFGVVRLRGFGKFSYRVVDASLLINTLVGTQGKLTTVEIIDFLRDNIVSGISEVLATSNIPLLDMPAKMSQLSAVARVKLGDQFTQLGLELTQLLINSISPPEEVQRVIDSRAGMASIGNLREYNIDQQAKDQSAKAPSEKPSTLGFDTSSVPIPRGERSPKDTLMQVAAKSGSEVQKIGEDFILTVKVGSLRRQQVHVSFSQRDDSGYPITQIWSGCGIVSPSNAMALLRSNKMLLYGAFALQTRPDGSDLLVIQANLLTETLESMELSRCISAIAFQADQIEDQISGGKDDM
ncbi:MAG: SPFH domain-containing protein [Planctomycetota bacterium]|nr:SPFH domain-containing protein [Planctomycetota bacterium]